MSKESQESSEIVFHEVVNIEEFEFDEELQTFFYPCPCGDKFLITMDDIFNGEDIARCPSCSLLVRVVYDPNDFVEEIVEEPKEELKDQLITAQ